jgi:hypothetical protein
MSWAWYVARMKEYRNAYVISGESSYLILPVALDPEVYSASNRNEYQKHKNNVPVE